MTGDAGRPLTADDIPPAVGTVVRDALGRLWRRYDEGGWLRDDCADPDPESWVKVAGNYGPVTVVSP